MAMKPALKLAYIGTDFSGSQAQPGKRTVEGELKKGLIEKGIIDERTRVSFSGRTDAGVHALGQVVSFKALDERLVEPRIINSVMPKDLWVYASASVPDDFDPRRDATSRTYRYVLYAPDVVERRIVECSKLFIGTHDFTNFSSVEPGKNPVRTIKNVSVTKRGDLYIIDVEADSFLWNMVRKMVTGLRLVGSNKRPARWIEQMLRPDEYREGIPPALAAGLYLVKVDYPAISFIEEAYSKGRAYQRMMHAFEWQYTMAAVYREFQDAMR
ncbi:tRNA pseudouridine(38-40) synthase TruA [Methanocella conradii]|uniref:tRNA pseudouridine(38-40) synthase TruA n=1 Tax=Methanocella conradii TaxID=1175444 RepID=UPI0024B32A34|nr:tRNA pseudouridine(38-40) synthase TruA [Methanocella conradii]MDI6895867.1 tRNA pseudouridine(38-40) synthase TruA [Methanocella conradii]